MPLSMTQTVNKASEQWTLHQRVVLLNILAPVSYQAHWKLVMIMMGSDMVTTPRNHPNFQTLILPNFHLHTEGCGCASLETRLPRSLTTLACLNYTRMCGPPRKFLQMAPAFSVKVKLFKATQFLGPTELILPLKMAWDVFCSRKLCPFHSW